MTSAWASPARTFDLLAEYDRNVDDLYSKWFAMPNLRHLSGKPMKLDTKELLELENIDLEKLNYESDAQKDEVRREYGRLMKGNLGVFNLRNRLAEDVKYAFDAAAGQYIGYVQRVAQAEEKLMLVLLDAPALRSALQPYAPAVVGYRNAILEWTRAPEGHAEAPYQALAEYDRLRPAFEEAVRAKADLDKMAKLL